MTPLSSHVESATAPDRGLDAEIAAHVKSFPANAPTWLLNWSGTIAPAPRVNHGAVAAWHTSGEMSVWWNSPHYTASLDAALTLIPKDTPWCAGSNDGWPDERPFLARVGGPVFTFGASPALAIVAAALKARGL